MNSFFKFVGKKKEPKLDAETLRAIQFAQQQMDFLNQQLKKKEVPCSNLKNPLNLP